MIALGCLIGSERTEGQDEGAGSLRVEPGKRDARGEFNGLENVEVGIEVREVEGEDADDLRGVLKIGEPECGFGILSQAIEDDLHQLEWLSGAIGDRDSEFQSAGLGCVVCTVKRRFHLRRNHQGPRSRAEFRKPRFRESFERWPKFEDSIDRALEACPKG